MIAKEQIKERFANSRFFDSEPRKQEDYFREWRNTHDWFILKEWKDHNVKLWVDVGYGFYALQEGKKVVGFGKDMIQTPKWIFLGEYYGEIVLAKVLS